MNDGVSMQPGAWGQVRVREPAGERVLGETLSIGGTGSDVVVPGVDAGAALSVRRLKGLWLVQPAPGAVVRFNGRPLSGERSEEHTSELQSLAYLVCRLLLEKKNSRRLSIS